MLLFVFLDGVGLGAHDPAVNPLAAARLPSFRHMAGEQAWTETAAPIDKPAHVFHPIDANLGVDGLPQSGTGQATLFSGINCAEAAGRHYGPFPHSTSRPILAAHNVFLQLQQLGLPHDEPSVFANAYPPRFFTYAETRDRWTVTTRCCLDAGLRIRTVEDVRAGRALTAEMTGEAWRTRLDLEVPPLTEAEAGAQLTHLAADHAFTLYEFFLTDKAGHSRDHDRATRVLEALDRFFAGLLSHLDPARDLLVVTSDHGNIEDLSTKSHTRRPVPLLALGAGAHHFRDVTDLTGVTPAVVAAVREMAA